MRAAWASAYFAAPGADDRGRGWPPGWRDVEQLDVKDERGSRGNARAALVAVGELGRDVELDLPALGDLLQALGPAGDHLVQRELNRLALALGAVEHGPVEELARVVHLHNIRRLRRVAGARRLDLVAEPVPDLGDGLVLAQLHKEGRALVQVVDPEAVQDRVLLLLHELRHRGTDLLQLEGRLLAVERREDALAEGIGLRRGQLELGKPGLLADVPAELLEELLVRVGRDSGRRRNGRGRGRGAAAGVLRDGSSTPRQGRGSVPSWEGVRASCDER